MSLERWQMIDYLLQGALGRDPPERAAFLDRACGGDDELRRELDSLLAAQPRASGRVESSPVDAIEELFKSEIAESLVGKALDRYKIGSLLGEGGMGKVYLAHDQKLLSKPVVIKVLSKVSKQDEWIRKKFRQEIEALARIDHPGVIGVLDAGETPNGDLYFVMQFVELEINAAAAAINCAFDRCGFLTKSFSTDTCLQNDDGLLSFNSTTGEYVFTRCGPGGFSITGTGTVTRRGCTVTLQNNLSDRRILVTVDTCQKRGTASGQLVSRGVTFSISDTNTTDNLCACP